MRISDWSSDVCSSDLPGIPEFMRDTVVPRADVLTPNHFELDFLAGRTTTTTEEVLEAVDEVRSRGPRDVLVTSVLARKSVVEGKSVSVRVGLGGRRIINKKNK